MIIVGTVIISYSSGDSIDSSSSSYSNIDSSNSDSNSDSKLYA